MRRLCLDWIYSVRHSALRYCFVCCPAWHGWYCCWSRQVW